MTSAVACDSSRPDPPQQPRPAPTRAAYPIAVDCSLVRVEDLNACGGRFSLLTRPTAEELAHERSIGLCIREFQNEDGAEFAVDVRTGDSEFPPDLDLVIEEHRALDVGDHARVRRTRREAPTFSGSSVSGNLIQRGLRVNIGGPATSCTLDAMESIVRTVSTRIDS